MQTKVLLHFANTGHRRLEHSLDELSLLGVHDLIVALLQLPEDVDVLDVQTGQVLEQFIWGPLVDVLRNKL